MKTMRKFLAFLMTMVLCVTMLAIPAFASSLSQDGLNIALTTDKETYVKYDEIVATLTVENTNEFAVTDVSLQDFIPEGYKLAADSEAVMQVETLGAGETTVLTAKFIADIPTTEEPTTEEPATEEPTTKKAVTDNPRTGDTANTAMRALLFIISGAGAAVLFIIGLKNKKAQKALSLALCIAVAGTTIGGIAVKVSATEAERKTVPMETIVTVDGVDLAIKAEVKYTLPVIDEDTVIGKVCKASDRITPVENATVSFYKNGELCKTVATDAEGAYILALADGDYTVEVTAEGYLPFNAGATVAVSNETVYLETFFLIEESEDETGIASGKIIDAFTGSGLSGVELKIYNGWGGTTGEVIDTITTNADGAYSVSLPLGNYTMRATKSGYIAINVNIVVKSGETPNQNGTMSPVVAEGEYRIVLTWGENPHDLDSHVQGQYSDGSTFHTYFSRKTANEGDITVCELDVDDRESYGPETITLKPTSSAPYYYYVYNYSGTGSFAASGAQVKVYRGETLVATYNAPTNQGNGRYWNIFAIVDGEIVVNNTITSSANLTYANGSVPETVLENTEAVTEETSAEEITVEETSAEETVTEETTVEETTAEETTIIEETTIEETTAEEVVAETEFISEE